MQFDVIHLVRIFRPNIGGMETIVENIALEQIKQGLSVCVLTTDFKREVISEDYKDKFIVIRLKHINIKNNFFPYGVPVGLNANILHIHGMDLFVDFTSLFINFNKKILSPHGGFFHTKNLLFFKRIYFYSISKFLYFDKSAYCISFNDVALMRKITRHSHYMGCGFVQRDVICSGERDAVIFGRIGKNKKVDHSLIFAKKFLKGSKINVIGHDEIGIMKNFLNDREIIYHGVVEDYRFEEIIKTCRYFVFMSEYEGLGMSLIEALDMGLRCIVTEIESFKIIYTQLDPALRDNFIFFINNDQNTLEIEFKNWKNIEITDNARSSIRKNVRDVFSWKRVVEKLTDGYSN